MSTLDYRPSRRPGNRLQISASMTYAVQCKLSAIRRLIGPRRLLQLEA